MKSLSLSQPKAALALASGLVLSATGIMWAPLHPAAVVSLAFALSWAAVVDIDRMILPDVITLGLLLLGLAIRIPNGFVALTPFLAGAVLGFLSLSLVAIVYERVRGRAGLGLGDAKLFAAGGAWLGANALAPVLFVASASALVWVLARRVMQTGNPDGLMPFGPFLATGIWTVMLAGLGA